MSGHDNEQKEARGRVRGGKERGSGGCWEEKGEKR